MKMRKLKFPVLAIALVFMLSSCGVGAAYVFNHNANTTQVQLSRNNFRVVDKVVGSSDVAYVLIFGGRTKKQLYQNAYADMINNADLQQGPRALINILTEEHIGGVPPFFYRRTITVSANVIEFTE